MVNSYEKEKMLQARTLIQQKMFAEARDILVTQENPTAKQWIVKIDALLNDDPFRQIAHPTVQHATYAAPTPLTPYAPLCLQTAVMAMTRCNWEITGVFASATSFRKREGPNRALCFLSVAAFSLLGSAIVCALISSARYCTTVLYENQDGTLTANTTYNQSILRSPSDIIVVAQEIPDSITYIQAIVGGIGSMILWLMLIPLIF